MDAIASHRRQMNEWLIWASTEAIRVTKRMEGQGQAAENLTNAGVRIAANTMAVIFPGVVLTGITAISFGVFGIYSEQLKLSEQVRYQNQLTQSTIEVLQQTIKDLKSTDASHDSLLRVLESRVTKLESRR